jgi:uncharacterized protein DUF6111
MLRILLTIVVPLILPTVIYLAWMQALRSAPRNGLDRWTALPWLWLTGTGVVLLVVVLLVITVGFGTSQSGVYVPPRWENGRIVPGHIEPGHVAPNASP